jgi:hypothetical protein
MRREPQVIKEEKMQSPHKLSKEKSSGIILVEGMITLMNDLIHIMSLEIELVNKRKLSEHNELLKRKQRLTIDYRSNFKSVVAQPDIVKQLPEQLRVTLRTTAHKLADSTDRNARFLRIAITAMQRLIQNIISIVKQEVLPKPGYRNPNTAHLALGTYSPVCKSVAVSRTA